VVIYSLDGRSYIVSSPWLSASNCKSESTSYPIMKMVRGTPARHDQYEGQLEITCKEGERRSEESKGLRRLHCSSGFISIVKRIAYTSCYSPYSTCQFNKSEVSREENRSRGRFSALCSSTNSHRRAIPTYLTDRHSQKV